MIYLVPGIILLFLIITASIYNGLVNKRNKVKNSWSQIDIQLKRRFDLIPNLVESVKGYAAHEKEAFTNVSELRSRFANSSVPSDKMAINSEMNGVLTKLFAISEAYPELKANTGFLDLQRELSETENKISFSRQFYNDVIMEYNNAVQMFPSNIFANLFGFKEEVFFQVDENERQSVSVKF